MLLAGVHLLVGTDSEDKRMERVCLFQVNIPLGLPACPQQTDLQEGRRELANFSHSDMHNLFISYFSFSAGLRVVFLLLALIYTRLWADYVCVLFPLCV